MESSYAAAEKEEENQKNDSPFRYTYSPEEIQGTR